MMISIRWNMLRMLTLLLVIVVAVVMLLHTPVLVIATSTTKSKTTTTTTTRQPPSSSLPHPKYRTIEQIQATIERYRIYPQRSRDEAAVIEWGHSAIISAIDASVAYFGPQTSEAAIFEVETSPILADPIDGIHYTDPNTKEKPTVVSILNNADVIHGNVAVMTDAATFSMSSSNSNSSSSNENAALDVPALLSCLDLAIMAQNSKAAALMIVHINEDRPDDAPRCKIPPGRESEAALIDIPIVTISLASVDVFTSATVTEDMKPEEIVNHGMPERIRLYAGGERPFFEDIETIEPTVYMIHNLLTLSECNSMIEQATQQTFRLVIPTLASNPLIEYMTDPTPYQNVERTVLHPGFMQSLIMKAIDERIEQVTGFPINRYSEWIIDRLTINSTYHPHYDNSLVPSELIPHATITVFLNDLSEYTDTITGGQLVYPTIGGTTAKNVNGNTDPIQIQSTQGLGVVHHNVNEQQILEKYSLHALLPITYQTNENTNPNDENASSSSSSSANATPYLYIAKKYILPIPISKMRRYTLPVYLMLLGRHGHTPMTNFLSDCYSICIQQFGIDHGNLYFDYIMVGVPVSILVLLVAVMGYQIYRQVYQNTTTTTTHNAFMITPPPPPSTVSNNHHNHKKKTKHSDKAPATKKKN